MSKHEEFIKVFNIPDDEYTMPSREYNDDGEICSWYIETVPAILTDERLINLILVFNTYCDTACVSTNREDLEDEIEDKLIKKYNKSKDENIKKAVLGVFKLNPLEG